MSLSVSPVLVAEPRLAVGRFGWIAAGGLSVAFASSWGDNLPKWMIDYPRSWTLDIQQWIAAAMYWVVDEAAVGPVSVSGITRGMAWCLDELMRLLQRLLVDGFASGSGSSAIVAFPPLPWIFVLGLSAWAGYRVGGRRLALLVALCLGYLVAFGQWSSAMVTLASIVIAVPLGIVGGVTFAIAAYGRPAIEKALTPFLDLMQTVPTFAYLVPVLFLFGFGPAAAILATVIYAMPPMVRVALLALKAVPVETIELGAMAGCTDRQLLWKILIPSAMPGLLVGLNQVIMLSLNMVIIASMIGAGGLGYDVLLALRRLDIGKGLEAGVAIVLLAIVLDRCGQSLANRSEPSHKSVTPATKRRNVAILSLFWVGALLASYTFGWMFPWLQIYPPDSAISTAVFWQSLIEWMTINLFDAIEAGKSVLLVTVMVPFKQVLLAQPWPWVLLILGIAGFRLGGLRLSLLVVGLAVSLLLTGLWEKAMITVYLCGVAIVLSALIGIPIGVLTAGRPGMYRPVHALIDTLQTLPTFVYLIPVVMLLRIGDVSAIIAIVAYAVAPAIRYTAHGLKQIDAQLVEAGVAAGCTHRQLLWKVKLPMALPEILLGANQTVMMALSMVVIAALVGTRDLGQEVFMALSRAEPGKGIVTGLGIAAIAITADRLISAKAQQAKSRMGLG